MNHALVKLARTISKQHGVVPRQSYTRVGKIALIKHQRYAHADQFKRANKALRNLKTYLGRVIRDIGRRIASNDALERDVCRTAELGPARTRTGPPPARPQGLLTARPGG